MDLGDAYRRPVASTVAVLLVSGTLDARTPVAQAEELARGFPNARQLVIEGASHDDDLFLSSPEIVRSMVAFLKGGEPTASRIVLAPLRFAVR